MRVYNNELTLPEASRVLQLSWAQTWRLVLRGDLAGRQVNGRWRIPRDAVRRFKASSVSETRRAPAA